MKFEHIKLYKKTLEKKVSAFILEKDNEFLIIFEINDSIYSEIGKNKEFLIQSANRTIKELLKESQV